MTEEAIVPQAPPLGVMPHDIWTDKRIIELAVAPIQGDQQSMILDLDQYAAEIGATTRDDLFYALRLRYCDHADIATLAATELRARDPELVKAADEFCATFVDDLGNCPFDTWDGVRHALGNGARVASEPTTADLADHYKGIPAIVVAAGPGAAARLDQIKAAVGRAVIFTCDVMIEPLLARGIVPDYVSAVERVPVTYECMQRIDKTGMTLLGPVVLEPRVVDDFGGRVLWTWRACPLERWLAPEVTAGNFGHSCGTSAIGAAIIAGCDPIYLVGHDLCMQGGKTHCGEADGSTAATANALGTTRHQTVVNDVNVYGRPVQTTTLWRLFRTDIELILRGRSETTVINTGAGLPIKGTVSRELPDRWMPCAIPGKPTRKAPGADPRQHIQTMLYRDLPRIREQCEAVCTAYKPNPEQLIMSRMAQPETALLWSEILQSLYYSGLVRGWLQPDQRGSVLRRTADAILGTLPTIGRDLAQLAGQK